MSVGELRIAIAGFGRMGGIYAEVLKRMPDARLAAVCTGQSPEAYNLRETDFAFRRRRPRDDRSLYPHSFATRFELVGETDVLQGDKL